MRPVVLLILLLLLLEKESISQVNLLQGLVAYYPLDGNALDASGNNIDGTISNVTPTIDRNGIPGKAFYFNGTDSYIQLPFSPLYDFAVTAEFSISAWIQPNVGSTWRTQAIVVKSPNSSNISSAWNYGIYLLDYRSMTGFNNNNFLVGNEALMPNHCWYHIVFTYNNGRWNLFLNGLPEASDNSQTRFILHDGSSGIALGRKGGAPGDY